MASGDRRQLRGRVPLLQAGGRAHGRPRRGGAIVNISSVDGIVPCLGTGYDSAKGALFQFTRSLAVDLAPFGIRVNCVAPGDVPVETIRRMKAGELPPLWAEPSVATGLMGPLARMRSSHIPLGRRGEPEEIAHAVLFLASRGVVCHGPDAGRRRRLDAHLTRQRQVEPVSSNDRIR